MRGDLSAPVPPIRESQNLTPKQHIEIYRWMLLNRRMEAALENLYKQGKVVGGVYFGLGQEAMLVRLRLRATARRTGWRR